MANESIGVATLGFWTADLDDQPSLAEVSFGYWLDQSSEVGFLELKITPDLGWPNIDAMFDPAKNSKLVSWRLGELETTLRAPTRAKGRDTLIFEYGGLRYKLQPESVGLLGGSTKHLWRVEFGAIDWFVLSRQSMSPEPRPGSSDWSGPTIGPRILS